MACFAHVIIGSSCEEWEIDVFGGLLFLLYDNKVFLFAISSIHIVSNLN